MQREEGFISVTGGKVWYEVVGKGENTPLVVLHGGPGYPHDYLQPLEELGNTRKVIFYDQLGCGNSQKPKDKSLWTVERFVDELRVIIASLGLEKYVLLGHSWGGALAVAFTHTNPKGLKGIILTNAYIGTPLWEKDAKRLIEQLPANMQEALKKGETSSREYKEAAQEFYFRYVYRMKELPTAVLKAENKVSSTIYTYMNGPEEFTTVGTLKDFDETSQLSHIAVPVLLICGRYDEATPESTEYFKNLLPNAQMKIFEKSAHFPFWTEKEEYLEIVSKFLHEIDKRQ